MGQTAIYINRQDSNKLNNIILIKVSAGEEGICLQKSVAGSSGA